MGQKGAGTGVACITMSLPRWWVFGDTAMTTQTTIKQCKPGEYFRMTDSETAPVWVRGEYDRTSRKFECYKFDDANHTRELAGARVVFIGFTF